MIRTVWGLCVLTAGATLAAEPGIDGASVPRWKACVAWVQNRPTSLGVANDNGALVFTAEGANTEMPWLLDLKGFGVSGDERYLLIRYQAVGVATPPGNYFLHGQEGTVGGRAYALADEVQADGRWHTLAVDLVAIQPLEITHRLAIKLIVGDGGSARLTVARIWFADELPADAQIAALPGQARQKTVTVTWPANEAIVPQPGWTRTPATDFEARPEGSATTFTVRDAAKGMRWLAALPQPVNLAATPYLSLRYRADGDLDGATYIIWLGGKRSSSGDEAIVALAAKDIQSDGTWHNTVVKVNAPFTATQLAIGLDCLSGHATLTLDTIRFSSRPLRWKLADMLVHQRRDAAWPRDKEGFVAEPIRIAGGRPSAFFAQRLGLEDWFSSPHVSIVGVPFEVPTDIGQIAQTGTDNFGTLSLALPQGVREVYLLTANSAPATEPWGIDWKHPKPQEMLDVPEKVFYEIRYESGPPDLVLPLDVATGRWGMKRGLSVNVVHPDPARRATELILHDRMQTASFAIVAATMRQDVPYFEEPNWDHLAYGPVPTNGLADARPATFSASEPAVGAGVLQAQFNTSAGLSWSQLEIAGLEGQLSCGDGPVFEVHVEGKLLSPADWSVEKTEAVGSGRCFVLKHAKSQLTARVECLAGQGNEMRMRMSLANTGSAPIAATLYFPILRDVRVGDSAGTWYLFGKRGGIVHSAKTRFREPLGERHPLQVDGFFNPHTGLALACMTHDQVAQHHLINVAKNDGGGQWYPEYVERDLAPGESFTPTEAALVLLAGDWRAIFSAYTDWLKTWFQPIAPRKPWFERAFAMASGNAHYAAAASPRERGAVEPNVDIMLQHIGLCDYTHLFGWSASKRYGDWGDYDHYDETVGGLAYFRDNIRRVQQRGVAVSLYLDGYLSSEQGKLVGTRAEQWAMKRPDGSPQFIAAYDAYNQCPYQQGWQDHLAAAYRRVQKDLQPQVMYIDEYGATDGRWLCHAKDHGHNGYEIPYAGEVAMLKRIREAVGPDVVLYTEYPPAEVSRQWLDGSITYQALWSADQESLAPHFIDLPRFAFPDFKQLHIIYYVTNRAGNWWLLKFPFFNGEVYRVGVPNLPTMDEPSLAFLRRAIEVQCAHRDAFASPDVHPLVPTEVSGVFANQFRTPKESVWTLYNANGRSVHQPVLQVEHMSGATYEDAWQGKPLLPAVQNGWARIATELGPKGIGCVVQKIP
ncbi:MAG: hypothetical protein H8E44_43145 [Planctomycetes bacterium]|nr:hypothetical protein [Planctomycetota bacterium]